MARKNVTACGIVFTLLSASNPAMSHGIHLVLVSESEINTASGGGDGNTSPSITPLSGGDFLVAWHDGSPATGWGRVYSNNGSTAGDQFSLNPNGPGAWQYGAVTAPLQDGGVVSFWGYNSESVLGQKFGSSFQPVGGDFFDLEQNDWPAATTLANGHVVLNTDYPNSGGGPILVTMFNSSLSRVLKSFNANTNPPGVGLGPAIAAAPNGNFAVAWNNDVGNAIVRFFSSRGTALTDEIAVNSGAISNCENPTLAFDSNNNLWIAWQATGNKGASNIYMQEFDASTQKVGTQILVGGRNASVPELAVSTSGTTSGSIAVSWTSNSDLGQEVSAKLFGSDGTALTKTIQANQYISGNQSTGWAGGRRGTWINGSYVYFAWRGTGAQGDGAYLTTYQVTN